MLLTARPCRVGEGAARLFGEVIMQACSIGAVCCLLALASVRPAAAQQTVDLGSVSGCVVDALGGAIADALVTARHTDTGVRVGTTSDHTGRFRLPYLRVGPYELLVQRDGFQPAVRRLTVGAAR